VPALAHRPVATRTIHRLALRGNSRLLRGRFVVGRAHCRNAFWAERAHQEADSSRDPRSPLPSSTATGAVVNPDDGYIGGNARPHSAGCRKRGKGDPGQLNVVAGYLFCVSHQAIRFPVRARLLPRGRTATRGTERDDLANSAAQGGRHRTRQQDTARFISRPAPSPGYLEDHPLAQ